jgi:hypothetical protein
MNAHPQKLFTVFCDSSNPIPVSCIGFPRVIYLVGTHVAFGFTQLRLFESPIITKSNQYSPRQGSERLLEFCETYESKNLVCPLAMIP